MADRTHRMAISSSVSKESSERGSYADVRVSRVREQARERHSRLGCTVCVPALYARLHAHRSSEVRSKHVPRAKGVVANERVIGRSEVFSRRIVVDMAASGRVENELLARHGT